MYEWKDKSEMMFASVEGASGVSDEQQMVSELQSKCVWTMSVY